MKARVVTIAVIVLLTLSVFAVGFTALDETDGANAAAGPAAASQTNSEDGATLSAFRFVCPLH